MVIKVVPLGAGQDVGRSCILLSINNKNIMLDCGMHMGYQDHRRYPDFSYISNTNDFDGMLDAVIISHFHLDHCGSLPYFTEICGYNGPIYMTYPTASITPILLEDMRKVMVDRKNETNFFTSMDIKNCMRKVTSVDLHEVIQVDPEIQIKAYYAGHVLGAALFHIRVTDRLGASETCVYTGDYNMTPDRHLGSAWIDNCRPDLLITESTYATTIRDSKRARERDFLKNVHDTVARGGKVLIPVFALGRAQELLILIESYWERMKDLANVPLYFSAGLTERANDYYKLFISWTNEKVKKTYTDHNMFDFRMIKPWKQEYAEEPGPMVLFASPGMLHAGTSLTVFTKWCHDPLNTIIMPGYCVAGTVGAKVLAGQKDIDIDRFNKVTVNMQIKHLSFSAHADAKGIMALIQMAEAKNVMLVHGEKMKMALLKKRIESELGIPCFDPANGETITIQPKPSIPLSTSAFHIESILSKSREKDENAVISEIPITGCIVLEQSRKKNNNQNMLYLASPEESLQKFNFNFNDFKPLTNEVMERCFKLEFNPYLIFPRLSFDHWKVKLLTFCRDFLQKNFSSPHTPAFDSEEETLKVGSVSISLTDECAYEIKCPEAFSKEANDILSLLNLVDLTKIV